MKSMKDLFKFMKGDKDEDSQKEKKIKEEVPEKNPKNKNIATSLFKRDITGKKIKISEKIAIAKLKEINDELAKTQSALYRDELDNLLFKAEQIIGLDERKQKTLFNTIRSNRQTSIPLQFRILFKKPNYVLLYDNSYIENELYGINPFLKGLHDLLSAGINLNEFVDLDIEKQKKLTFLSRAIIPLIKSNKISFDEIASLSSDKLESILMNYINEDEKMLKKLDEGDSEVIEKLVLEIKTEIENEADHHKKLK